MLEQFDVAGVAFRLGFELRAVKGANPLAVNPPVYSESGVAMLAGDDVKLAHGLASRNTRKICVKFGFRRFEICVELSRCCAAFRR
jgi:hypothetical protein